VSKLSFNYKNPINHEADFKIREEKLNHFSSEFFPYPVHSLLDGAEESLLVLAEEFRKERDVAV